MKKICLAVILLIGFNQLYAQLAYRINDTVSYSFATRPQKGDKALLTSFVVKDTALKTLKLYDVLKLSDKLVFKYYLTNQNVLRAGIRLTRTNDFQRGTIADSSFYNPIIKPHLANNRYKVASTEIILKPGFEKHVKTFNVFDIYSGADLFIGYSRLNVISNTSQTNGDYHDLQLTSNRALLGGQVFAGVNVFIAKLPLSVGLEYAWNGLTTLGNKVKVSVQDQIGSGTNLTKAYAAEYYINKKDVNGLVDNNLYGKITRGNSSFGLNQNIRITANFYFK
jgi:hypothetical protein